jgi:Holliday junction DNA helicase RuvA
MNLVDYVAGELVERGLDSLVVAVGGMGLRIRTSSRTAAEAPAVGESVRLVTYLYVREDARTLYGFATIEERELFTRLLTVGGVGPRTALAALSLLSVEQLATTIAAGDAQALARIPGIGVRTATRIVVELRGKLPSIDVPAAGAIPGGVETGAHADVVTALRGMGFTPGEIATRVTALPRDQALSTEEALHRALRHAEPH